MGTSIHRSGREDGQGSQGHHREQQSWAESRTALKARFLSRQDSAGGTSTVQSRVLSPLLFILIFDTKIFYMM